MAVVLFDGVCNLCNGSVNWLIDHDKKNVLQFASLQSDYGQKMVNKFNLQGSYLDTMILVDGENYYVRSTAILHMLRLMGGIYSMAFAFVIIPVFIRDAFYNFIARNRYRWFGKQDACRIPTPELKAKFLE